MKWLSLLASLLSCLAVDRSKFRTCKQTGFCKRTRGDNFQSQNYVVDLSTLSTATTSATVNLRNTRHPLQDPLQLTVAVLVNDFVRVSVRDPTSKYPRYEVPHVLQPAGLVPAADVKFTSDATGFTAAWGDNYELRVDASPFVATLLQNGKPAVATNPNGLMQFEQYRDKNPKPEGDGLPDEAIKFPYDVEDMWEEKFQSHSDSKPRGPAAVAMDVTFPGAGHLYGIPEHASSFALKNTDGSQGGYSEPYRLYNLDVFEYELDEPMALYGAVPLILSHDTEKTSGLLWLNAAETFIDINDDLTGKASRWISESGIIDIFMMTTPKPSDFFFAYASLTGFAALPPMFAISYHQCRWNYKSENDVKQVNAGFDKNDIPYDVLWLDIEHTDGKRYFTWDRHQFPSPEEMQKNIAAHGRKMVTIIDPHIKRDIGYHVHKQAENQGFYIQTSSKKDYEGWCWPGSVSYLDFTRKEVRDYWASLFALDKYTGSTPDLYVWNDMNEPSVFNGPEVTMQKDNLHMQGTVEHRDVHNMYGFYHHWATEQGLAENRDNARPFVLTRSFFAGSQRYGAVWTGDNEAKWSHLQAAAPMLLSMNVAGITFSGADVGGFFGNPEVELLVRWYQAAAFQPFFRGHAHVDTKRREPWLFGEPHTSHIRKAIRSRYAYLPYIYTTFHESSTAGMPVMRPLWVEFPSDKATFSYDEGFMLGSALLIKPVTERGHTSTNVYLPAIGTTWYCTTTGTSFNGGQTMAVDAPIDFIPVYQRGGTIIPKRERARRSSAAMARDPYTLVVALNNENRAIGTLYTDDGNSFDFQKGVYVSRAFRFSKDTLSSQILLPGTGQTATTIERVKIFGAPQYTKAEITTHDGQKRSLEVMQGGGALIIRKPDAFVDKDWTISLSL